MQCPGQCPLVLVVSYVGQLEVHVSVCFVVGQLPSCLYFDLVCDFVKRLSVSVVIVSWLHRSSSVV